MKNSFANQLFLFFNPVLKRLQAFRKAFKKFSEKYPNTAQTIQLSCIYFCALIDLVQSILNNIFSLSYFPEFLNPILPVLKSILMSPIFQIWASPEKVFFLSYVVIEFMVIRSIFQFSKLIKYNILLLFSLLMLQGLTMSYWDLLFNREISESVSEWVYGSGMLIYTDRQVAIVFFALTFLLFLISYLYLYLTAIEGKFALLPRMNWLTDSIAFWLRIKTPTMPFGKKK